MAFYIEEEEVWKCRKHPSQRRRNGVCPVCLKDRLVILCPDCANVRPCSCAAAATTSSSSSSDGNPNLRRYGSVGINFLRFSYARSFSGRTNPTATGKSKTPSFWSIILPSSKSRREPDYKENGYPDEKIAEFTRLITRSRSVASGSENRGPGGGWQFPGRMKISRHSKPAKVVQERYPSCNV